MNSEKGNTQYGGSSSSALRWILNTKIMENNLRLLYVIMIPFMFVTTRTIFLHISSVFSFRCNILQIICMQKLKCMYLTWNSSGVYLRPKNCNYSHRKILNELFGYEGKKLSEAWITDYYFSRRHTLFFSDLASYNSLKLKLHLSWSLAKGRSFKNPHHRLLAEAKRQFW